MESIRVGDVRIIAYVREVEGMTVIIEEAVANEQGWPVIFRAGWITLEV